MRIRLPNQVKILRGKELGEGYDYPIWQWNKKGISGAVPENRAVTEYHDRGKQQAQTYPYPEVIRLRNGIFNAGKLISVACTIASTATPADIAFT